MTPFFPPEQLSGPRCVVRCHRTPPIYSRVDAEPVPPCLQTCGLDPVGFAEQVGFAEPVEFAGRVKPVSSGRFSPPRFRTLPANSTASWRLDLQNRFRPPCQLQYLIVQLWQIFTSPFCRCRNTDSPPPLTAFVGKNSCLHR